MTKFDIIKAISLTSAEKKALADCDSKLQRLYELGDVYRDPKEAVANGKPSGVWDRICDTAEAFVQNPTADNFREHLAVIAERDLLERNSGGLRDLGTRAMNRAKEVHKHVMVAVLNRCITQTDKEAASRRQAAESAGFGAQLAVICDSLKAEFANDKNTGNPSGWLSDHGYID